MRIFLAAAVALSALLALPPAPRAEQGRDAFGVMDGETAAVSFFREALRRIRDNSLEPISDQQLAEIAVSAMAGRDRYSKFLPPDELAIMRAEARGEITGIGIRYEAADGRIRVTDILPGSPAERSDMRVGDAVLEVDGVAVGADVDDLARRVRGPEGSSVRLTLQRGADAPEVRTLTRTTMAVASVRWNSSAEVGYIRILRFDRRTAPLVSEALHSAAAAPGIVLDLRDNPGGLVQASADVADAFLERGTIMTSQGRGDGANRVMRATAGDESGRRPLVVLINGRTASAAEILAGALKDHGRAVLVGSRSFGKGIIQSIFPLAGGGAVKLTVAEYHTPAGHAIQKLGIVPDIVVETAEPPPRPRTGAPDPAVDPVYARALAVLRSAPTTDPARPASVSLGAARPGAAVGEGG